MKMPAFRRQSSPQAVVDEHIDALNRSDWERLMAQYPDDVRIFLPDGLLIAGRQQVGEVFQTLVKPFKEGGLGGVTFTPEQTFVAGNTVSVQWRATADFLVGPYRGADAYVTRDGLLCAQVSTFRAEELKALHRKEKGIRKKE